MLTRVATRGIGIPATFIEAKENCMTEKGKDQIVRAFRAVFLAFLGVNKRKNLEADATQLNPFAVVIAAFVALGAFIALLLIVVHLVVG